MTSPLDVITSSDPSGQITELADSGEQMALPKPIETVNEANETVYFLPPGAHVEIDPDEFEPLVGTDQLKEEGIVTPGANVLGILLAPNDKASFLILDFGTSRGAEQNRYLLMTKAGFVKSAVRGSKGSELVVSEGDEMCGIPDLGSLTIGRDGRYAESYTSQKQSPNMSEKHADLRADEKGILTILDTGSTNGTRFVTGPRR